MLTRKQFQEHIERVLNDPETPTKVKGDRTFYWDHQFKAVIIKDPTSKELATMFQPKKGKIYFDELSKDEEQNR